MPLLSDTSREPAVRLEPHPEGEGLVVCTVRFPDPDSHGRSVKLRLDRVVRVRDSRPVHGRATLWETSFRVEGPEHAFEIPVERLGRGYAYDGTQIEMRLESRLEMDDGLLFDTEVTGVHRLRTLARPRVDGSATELAEPGDAFDFFANLGAIPPRARVLTGLLAVVGALLILANGWVGLHDQLSPEGGTWLYSHTNSDGESQSPLVAALMGCGVLGAMVWIAMRRQLRKYMTLEVADPPTLTRETVVPAGRLVRGRARVPLRDARVRIVAYNLELGRYERGSGSSRRTVSFATPVRAVVLYEHRLGHLPAGMPLEEALPGAVDFCPFFAALYPPCTLGDTHGVDVRWEVQLLHDTFVDQEVVRHGSDLPYEAFLDP